MTLDEAKTIVGRANAAQPFLNNMIHALRLLPRLNTAEENRRLAAALVIRRSLRTGGR